jgi:hypothetical protein
MGVTIWWSAGLEEFAYGGWDARKVAVPKKTMISTRTLNRTAGVTHMLNWQ